MYENLIRTSATRRKPNTTPVRFGPYSRGISTERDAEQINNFACEKLRNFVITEDGMIRTRTGIDEVCVIMEGTIPQQIRYIGDVKVGGTWYRIASTYEQTADMSRVWYCESGAGVKITELSGDRDIRFAGFNDRLIIFDGTHIKVWDGASVTLLYDNGLTAAESYQFSNRFGETNGAPVALGNGTITHAIYQWTTATWESGFAVPPTWFFAKISRVGNGFTGTDNQPIIFELYERLGATPAPGTDTLRVQQNFREKAGDIQTTSAEYDIIIDSASFIGGWSGLDPGTDYYVAMNYNNGDSTNYINVESSRVQSISVNPPGTWAGVFTATATDKPAMALRPNSDPAERTAFQAVDGVVHDHRLWVIEGSDGVNPGRVWYSGVEDAYDWAWLDIGRDVGGIRSFYDDLHVFGTSEDPGHSRITGSLPANFVQSDTIPGISGHYKSLVTTPDDLYFITPYGVGSVRTMMEYGDVRSFTQTDDIRNIIIENWSDGVIAEYEPENSLVLFSFGDQPDETGFNIMTNIYAVHTKARSSKVIGGSQVSVSPVSLFQFNPLISVFVQEITAMGRGASGTYLGTDYGRIFRMMSYDPDNTTTFGSQSVTVNLSLCDGSAESRVRYDVSTVRQTTGIGEMGAYKVHWDAFSRKGGDFTIRFYKNHDRTFWHEIQVSLPDIDEGDSPADYFNRENINFNFRDLGVEIVVNNDILAGETPLKEPITFGPVTLLTYNIGGF